MAFQCSVSNKLLNKILPSLLEVLVLCADQIVPVYNDRRNCRASGEKYEIL